MTTQKLPLAVLALAAIMPVLALASPVPALNTFESGQPILAQEFNENFDAFKAAIDDNDARISAMEGEQQELIVVRASNTIATAIQDTSTTIPFNDEEEDTHGAYDTTTGVFTCPRQALLQTSFNVYFEDLASAGGTQLIFVQGPTQQYELARLIVADAPASNLSGSLAIRCEAEGDEWRFRALCNEADGCQTRPQSGTRRYSNMSILESR
jgi:hypothetical protein